jgi:hypothetical protein
MGSIVVVLGVLNPAGSERQFLIVLEVLVAGAIGADKTTSLGITCGCQWVIRQLAIARCVPIYYA